MRSISSYEARRNACADLVAVIGGRDFATLERNFFEFAKAMLP